MTRSPNPKPVRRIRGGKNGKAAAYAKAITYLEQFICRDCHALVWECTCLTPREQLARIRKRIAALEEELQGLHITADELLSRVEGTESPMSATRNMGGFARHMWDDIDTPGW
jgi:hypothetical protein